MSNAEKLKKKAAEFEAKRQMDKALATYLELFRVWDNDAASEVDVALYNRVGDMLLREKNVGDAMSVLEKAVDHYADGGFHNNAIALCNKILRHSPGRSSIYYKLGKISAYKGFRGDAKKNFLEYADRMQKADQIDEAFRALKEFADLSPDDEDIRQMLADQLAKLGRNEEAIEQLQVLYERFESVGKSAEAAATVDRMKAIDPSVEPKRGGPRRSRETQGLVFIDLTDTVGGRGSRKSVRLSTAALRRSSAMLTPKAVAGLPLIHTGDEEEVAEKPVAPVEGLQPTVTEPATSEPTPPPAPLVDNITFGASFGTEELSVSEVAEAPPLSGLESTSFSGGLGEGAVSSSLSSPEDATFGTGGADIGLDIEPTGIGVDEPPSSVDLDEMAPIEPIEFIATESPVPAEEITISTGALALEDAPAEPTPDSVDIVADAPEERRVSSPTSALDEATAAPPDIALEETPVPELDAESLAEAAPDIAAEADAAEDAIAALDSDLIEAVASDADDDVAGPDADRAAETAVADAVPPDADAAPKPGSALADDDEMDFAAELRRSSEVDLTTDLGAAVADELAAEARASAATDKAEATADAGPRRSSRSTMSVLAQSVDALRGRVSLDAMNWQLRRELGEALLDSGEREQGLAELETAMVGFERDDDLESARSLADEIIRLKPHSVRHHQKRVEFAFRMSDRARLLESYIELADALFRDGQTEKSRAVYHRVLELAPDDLRAQAALSSFIDEAAPQPAPEPPRAIDEPRRTQMSKRYTAETPIATEAIKPAPAPASEGDFVNLEDWLREDESPKSTRMVVEEKEPTGDEDADFNDMLRKFKQGVAQNVEEEDYESHYDLGIAYKEMGLIDEAIGEFQTALRGPSHRVRTYESLGQCFMDKGQESVAIALLQRALAEPGVGDDQLVGVLYLLGVASEAVGHPADAVKHYQRVFAVDINFRDVQKRMRALEKTNR